MSQIYLNTVWLIPVFEQAIFSKLCTATFIYPQLFIGIQRLRGCKKVQVLVCVRRWERGGGGEKGENVGDGAAFRWEEKGALIYVGKHFFAR